MGKLAQSALAAAVVSNAAYTLVDLSGLDPEDRKAIEDDAANGAGLFGIRVVEEVVYGGARAPLYGYYKDGPEGERWAKAKKEYGIGADDAEDAEVRGNAGGIGTDARREAALRQAAAQRAEAEAAALRAGEDAAVREVTGETDGEAAQRAVDSRARMEPTSNIVDATLAPNATNEAANAGPSENTDKDGNTKPASKSKSKTPR